MSIRFRIIIYISLVTTLLLFLTMDKWLTDPVRHSIANKLVRFDTYAAVALTKNAEGTFLIKAKDEVIGETLRSGRIWAERELDIIRQLTNAESKVVFVGAHIGTLAIPVSRSVNQVLAIEPNPETFELLEANVALNKRLNIRTIQIAANDKRGEIQFLIHSRNSGGSKRLPFYKTDEYLSDSPRLISVAADRLDQVVPWKLDLIHMDIEGSEYFALQGMPRLLSETKYLLIEFIPHHLKDVASVTVDQFLGVISPHFDLMYIPSKAVTVSKQDFKRVLQEMFDRNDNEDVLIFAKLTHPMFSLKK